MYYAGLHVRIRIENGVEGEQVFRVSCESHKEFMGLKQKLEEELKAHNVEVIYAREIAINELTESSFEQELIWLIKRPIFRSTDGLPPLTLFYDLMRLWEKCNLPGRPPMRRHGFPAE
jgi:hypothetical protein